MLDALWPVCHGLTKVVRANAPGRVWPMGCCKVRRLVPSLPADAPDVLIEHSVKSGAHDAS